jgi:hypothetical protein
MASPLKNRALLLDISYTKTAKAPHKYDHFHSKTFIETFIPTFQSNYFTNVLRRGEKPYELPPPNGRFQMLPVRPLFGFRRNHSEEPRLKRIWRPKAPALKKLPELHQHIYPMISAELNFDNVPEADNASTVDRRVLCVEDGSAMDSDDFRFYEVDITDFKLRFIGKKVPKKFDENRDVLLKQGLKELFEIVSIGVKAQTPFTHMFTLDGLEITSLLRVPEGTRVLLFSASATFVGLQLSK